MTEPQKMKERMIVWLKSLGQDLQRSLVMYIIVGAGAGVWLLAKLKVIGGVVYELVNIQISISLTLLLCALFYILFKSIVKPKLKPKEQSPINWKLHEKVILPRGNYYDVFDKEDNKILRITLKGISEEDMPPPYEYPKNHRPEPYRTEAATLSFDPFFVFPGSYVKKVETSPFSDESHFALAKNTYSEESNSVFFFRTDTTGYAQFFRCFVSHINSSKQEVELDIYFLQTT